MYQDQQRWKPGKVEEQSRKQIPPHWLRSDRRIDQSPSFPISGRSQRIISHEVSRCRALLAKQKDGSAAGPVWLVQGTYPRKGSSLPPILNDEGRITGGNDFRSALGNKMSVFQVNNTLTTVTSTPNRSKFWQQDARKEKKNDDGSESCETRAILPRILGHVGESPEKESSQKEEPALSIPLHPRFVASVVRHWISPSPSEGLNKALVDFSVRDRNYKTSKKRYALKPIFEKRKTVAMAFLLYVDKNGVGAYEKTFWPLNGKFFDGKALKSSREYIGKECMGNPSLKKFLRDEFQVKLFTNRVFEKLDLKKIVENALKAV